MAMTRVYFPLHLIRFGENFLEDRGFSGKVISWLVEMNAPTTVIDLDTDRVEWFIELPDDIAVAFQLRWAENI